MTRDAQCKRCCIAEETEMHIYFFECQYAQAVWRASGIPCHIILNSSVSLEEKIEACLHCCTSMRLKHQQDLPFWILWRLWKSRNVLIFQQKAIHWKTSLQYAKDDVKEWNNVDMVPMGVSQS